MAALHPTDIWNAVFDGVNSALKYVFTLEDKTPTDLAKTVASTATPEVLVASSTKFQSAVIVGQNAAQTNNSTTAYLGTVGAQDVPIAPGETITISAPVGKQLDLNNFYLDVGTNGDGIRGFYV